MSSLVDLLIEDPRWETAGLPALADAAARAIFDVLHLPRDGYAISLLGADDARIAVLNADFRGKPVPTNVLSWPAEERAPATPGAMPKPPRPGHADAPEELGDIALAYETCQVEAEQQAKPFAHHVQHLVIHGILHLLGYDHIDDRDAARMEAAEVRALAALGIPDPY